MSTLGGIDSTEKMGTKDSIERRAVITDGIKTRIGPGTIDSDGIKTKIGPGI